jgi:3-oxoacyl-[acyl-carrier protein] reductase
MSNAILRGKQAVVFGAGGSIGAAVARQFAAEGAVVFLSGRAKANVEAVARQITKDRGRAYAAELDAADDAGVNRYLDSIVTETGNPGKLDIVINATGPRAREYDNGKLAVDLGINEFLVPMTTIVKSHFITARAAARHMVKQHSGVIIFVTGSPARGHVPGATAIGAAFGALENLTENLAVEVSPFGVRVVCVRTLANTDSRTIQDTFEALSVPEDQAIAQVANSNFLKMPATVSDTANAAVLVASDGARMLTGTVVNATAGAAAD